MKTKEIDLLLEEIKKLHLETIFTEENHNGVVVNSSEFFEKLKPLLEEKIKKNE